MAHKILIIDDDELIVSTLKKKLEGEGLAVVSAENGQKGIDLAFSEKPDLILLDIIMPGKHGVEVMNALKNDKWGKTVPVIILSNFPDYPGLEEHVSEYEYELVGKNESHLDDLIVKVKEKLGV